jgi:hypothetical protein
MNHSRNPDTSFSPSLHPLPLPTLPLFLTYSPTHPQHQSHTTLHNIKLLLQTNNQLPLILTDIIPEELLQRIDTLPANRRVQDILLFEMAAVHWLITAFDLDGHGRLALFTNGNLFVVAFDGGAVMK